jgi:hypothetical protein
MDPRGRREAGALSNENFKQSAALATEVGTRLIEADGSRTTWHQYPDVELTPPQQCDAAARQLPLRLSRT